ncbi:doxx family protein [Reichenbachiella sp. 5M10]|uniref:doxx family protein n=1 Tax=Reichenbachiella sp. 5M10 TaxID=1889772 RepID=UPI000C393AF8|nr:doxx family protein [Reichenbachiella sp. 5M10]PIB35535.1 doxx family protein [Reichenbachiella sp. 5M10]
MMSVKELSNRIDLWVQYLADRYGVVLLESSIGVIYLWFGVLKYFPNSSPAESLAADTLGLMTFDLIVPSVLIKVLATWEVVMGLLLILRVRTRWLMYFLLGHLVGTLSPVLLFPDQVFVYPPFGFSLLGQYIIKNLVILSAALVIYAKGKK